jgi:hypothetical protein
MSSPELSDVEKDSKKCLRELEREERHLNEG